MATRQRPASDQGKGAGTSLPRVPIPERGLLKGGIYDGWHYTLLAVVDLREEFQVVMDMRVSDPHWPFPRDVRLEPWVDFNSMVPDSSAPRRERAELLDWNELLATAVQTAYDAELRRMDRAKRQATMSPTSDARQ